MGQEVENQDMKKLIATTLLLPTLAISQELTQFENGQVANADDINSNFDILKSQIDEKGSCSAEPSGSSVVISCTDGTSGTLHSAGVIVVGLPEGEQGQIIETFYTGTIVAKDANGTLIGEYIGDSGNSLRLVIDKTSDDDLGRHIYVNNEISAIYGEFSGGQKIYFEDPDCQGAAFSTAQKNVFDLAGTYYPADPNSSNNWPQWYTFEAEQTYTNKLVASSRERSDCTNESNLVLDFVRLLTPYTLPPELSGMAFPAYLEQLP